MSQRAALVSVWLACISHGHCARTLSSRRNQVAFQISANASAKYSASNSHSLNFARAMLLLSHAGLTQSPGARASYRRLAPHMAQSTNRQLGRRSIATMNWNVGADGAKGQVAAVDIANLVARCIELAEEAGKKMREVQARPNLEIVDKGGEQNVVGEYVADVQTAADREVQELCVSALLAEFPGIAIVAEEDIPQEPGSSSRIATLETPEALAASSAAWPVELRKIDPRRIVVYIDPLDGTGEFVKGNLLFVTNLIGIAVDGVPVAGIINQPWAPGMPDGRTLWGGRGVGVHGLDDLPRRAQYAICTNRVVRSNRCAGALRALGVTPENDAQRASASGYNLLCVLEGQCDLFVLTRHGTKKWDSCAGEALLREVGGIVTDAIGRRYFYSAERNKYMNSCGLLAARNRTLHARAAQVIADTLAPWPSEVEDASIVA